MREQKPDVQLVAVEPAESPVLSGGRPGFHQVSNSCLVLLVFEPVLQDAITLHTSAAVEQGCSLKNKLVQFSRGLSAGKRQHNHRRYNKMILEASTFVIKATHACSKPCAYRRHAC